MISSQSDRPMFHHLYSQSMRPLEMIDEYYQQVLQSWLCSSCKSPRPGTEAVDVIVENQGTRSRTALNIVMGAGVAIAKREVLFSLGVERVLRDLYIGQVLRRTGTPVEDLVTFRGKKSLFVRGRKNASFRQCSECGNLLYFSPIGDRYLHGAPPREHDVFESQLWGLIFSDDIAKGLDLKCWERVTHEVLPIRDTPLDAFGDLDEIAGRFRL